MLRGGHEHVQIIRCALAQGRENGICLRAPTHMAQRHGHTELRRDLARKQSRQGLPAGERCRMVEPLISEPSRSQPHRRIIAEPFGGEHQQSIRLHQPARQPFRLGALQQPVPVQSCLGNTQQVSNVRSPHHVEQVCGAVAQSDVVHAARQHGDHVAQCVLAVAASGTVGERDQRVDVSLAIFVGHGPGHLSIRCMPL